MKGVFRTQPNILQWSFFAKYIYIFAKFTIKHLCWSLILIKLQVSILQFHWKKGLQNRCFLVNFARYLRNLFYSTPPGDYFCSVEKIFYQQNSKEPSENRENNRNSLQEKQSHRQNKNLITIYIKSSYPFTIQKCLHFPFLCFL